MPNKRRQTLKKLKHATPEVKANNSGLEEVAFIFSQMTLDAYKGKKLKLEILDNIVKTLRERVNPTPELKSKPPKADSPTKLPPLLELIARQEKHKLSE